MNTEELKKSEDLVKMSIQELENSRSRMKALEEEDFESFMWMAKNFSKDMDESAEKYNLPYRIRYEFLENHPLPEKHSQYR